MTPETAEKKAIKDYLNAKCYFWWYNLQGLGAYKGIPDLMVLKDGKIYGIEVKTSKGHISEKQLEFSNKFILEGGSFICGGIDEVMKIL